LIQQFEQLEDAVIGRAAVLNVGLAVLDHH
jgi:hypothetical protein